MKSMLWLFSGHRGQFVDIQFFPGIRNIMKEILNAINYEVI